MSDKKTISDREEGPGTGRVPRQRRHDAKLTQIVAESWEVARREGLSGISLRDLAERVDLRQPSLYAYFDSKIGLYDLMYADAMRQLLAAAAALPPTMDATDALVEFVELCIRFSSENVVRHQLLFERTIPGFKPSAQSRALLVQFRDIAANRLVAAGVRDPAAADIFTGIVSGFTQQQVIGEPGGSRWVRLARPAIEMYLAGLPQLSEPARHSQRLTQRTIPR
jgi:AcrR family transcriptional regulator